MKEQVISGINKWIGSLIDDIAPNNILFALTSTLIKRVVSQYIEDKVNFDAIKPFIVNKAGEIDAETTMKEMMASLKNMPKKAYNFQNIKVEIGDGAVVIHIPDTPTIGLLTDHLKKITLTEKDFLKLSDYIKNDEL